MSLPEKIDAYLKQIWLPGWTKREPSEMTAPSAIPCKVISELTIQVKKHKKVI